VLILKVSAYDVARISQWGVFGGVWGAKLLAAKGHWGSGGEASLHWRLRVWRQSSQLPEVKGSGDGASSAGRFFNFLIKITHFYENFGQNSYFKAITHQLKAFKITLNVLNRIHEVHSNLDLTD